MEQNTGNEPVAKERFKGFNSQNRVRITVTSFRRRQHDTDGISAKAFIDGLVRRGILEDDSCKQIKEIVFKSIIIKNDEEEKTIIEITDEGL